MKKADFLKAIELISESHTTELIINKPLGSSVGTLGEGTFTIGIKNSCAAVVSRLVEAGFTMSMENGLLTVSKF